MKSEKEKIDLTAHSAATYLEYTRAFAHSCGDIFSPVAIDQLSRLNALRETDKLDSSLRSAGRAKKNKILACSVIGGLAAFCLTPVLVDYITRLRRHR